MTSLFLQYLVYVFALSRVQKLCNIIIFFCILTQWSALHLCKPLSPAESCERKQQPFVTAAHTALWWHQHCAAFWKPQALSCVWFRTFLSSYMIAILAAPIDGFWVSRQEVDFLRLVECLKSLLRTDKYLPVKIGGYLLNETRVWSYSLKFSYRGGGCLCLCSLNQNMNTAFILSWVYFFELLLLFTSQTLLYNGFLFVSRDSSK